MPADHQLAVTERIPTGSADHGPIVVLVHGSLDRAGSFARVTRRLVDLHTVATVLSGIEDVITATVAKGEKVVITGFLTFDRAQRAARSGRNPQTGETIKIKASKSPKVSAGATFKKVVNGQAPAPKIIKAK
jgi:DNA-binding protein HU-beta